MECASGMGMHINMAARVLLFIDRYCTCFNEMNTLMQVVMV